MTRASISALESRNAAVTRMERGQSEAEKGTSRVKPSADTAAFKLEWPTWKLSTFMVANEQVLMRRS